LWLAQSFDVADFFLGDAQKLFELPFDCPNHYTVDYLSWDDYVLMNGLCTVHQGHVCWKHVEILWSSDCPGLFLACLMLVLSLNIIWLLKNVMLMGVSETLVKDTKKKKVVINKWNIFYFLWIVIQFSL